MDMNEMKNIAIAGVLGLSLAVFVCMCCHLVAILFSIIT